MDLWRSARFDGGTGALDLGAARVLGGGHYTTVRAPLDEIPLFVRAGAVLALLPPDVQTLTDYGSGVVHMSDRRSELRLIAFPRGRTKIRLGDGEWLRSTEGRREWRLKLSGKRRRVYRLQASMATLARPVPAVRDPRRQEAQAVAARVELRPRDARAARAGEAEVRDRHRAAQVRRTALTLTHPAAGRSASAAARCPPGPPRSPRT